VAALPLSILSRRLHVRYAGAPHDQTNDIITHPVVRLTAWTPGCSSVGSGVQRCCYNDGAEIVRDLSKSAPRQFGIGWLIPVFGAGVMGLFLYCVGRSDAQRAASIRNEQETPAW